MQSEFCCSSLLPGTILIIVSHAQELIDNYALSGKWHECLGEVLRFQIINGTLWIDHLSERHAGWYPARLGPGTVRTCWSPVDPMLHHAQSCGIQLV